MTQITQCIKLICVQSYKDFEIICIDDCSEDSTLQVLNMIQKENSSVRVISNKSRLFVSSCRSIGIKEAKGEYLIFIDSDDMLMDSSFFQKSVDTFLNNKEIDIIIGKTLIWKNPECDNFRIDIDVNPKSECLVKNEIFSPKYGWTILGKIIKKSLFTKYDLSFFETKIIKGEEFLYFLLFSVCNDFAFHDNFVYVKNIHPLSFTNPEKPNDKSEVEKEVKECFKEVEKNISRLEKTKTFSLELMELYLKAKY